MPDFPLPAMSEARIRALMEAFQNANAYLEFGMGGSTTLAARMGIPNVFSVDSSLDWVNNITSQISQIPLKGKVQLLHANLGPTGAWGYPLDASNIAMWPTYYAGPWHAVRAAGLEPDLVLVDGRFRVACFLYSLLNLKPGATILWDDYTNRPEYHSVEQYLRPSAYHDEMAVFRVTGNEDLRGALDQLFFGLYVLD